MKKLKQPFLIVSLCILSIFTYSQEKWDLRRCVEYAITNNISVKQADVQARLAELTTKQSKLSRYPNASFSTNAGLSFGRSIDPTTNLFTSTQLLTQQLNLNVDAVVFNWGRITNNIKAAEYNFKASKADVDKTKNDIALNVANSFLNALLSQELLNVLGVQIEQTQSRLNDTRKRVEAGILPELNALELEAQLARDSSSYYTQLATVEQNLLSLKALMNLDVATPFVVEVSDLNKIPLENIADLQPDFVYQLALTTQPAQIALGLRLQALNATLKSQKAQLYPTLSFFAGLGDNFSSSFNKFNASTSGFVPNGSIVNIGTNSFNVLSPNVVFSQSKKSFSELWDGYGNQLDQNFRQNIGISISVPIFNGGSARTSYERSKLDIKNNTLLKEQTDQKLKLDIFQAYAAAMAAFQKYNAQHKTEITTQKTYEISLKRYELGVLSTLDLIINQTNYNRAKADAVIAKYDYIFKIKVLEFYKGQGIKL